MTAKDWLEWHTAYDDADAPLHHRLLAVQRRIRDWLDQRPPGPIRVVSMCAGEGRDLLEVLADHSRAGDVHGRLVELNPELAARATALAPPGITVEVADAGSTDAYLGAVPADLVLACGIFGHIGDDDIRRTVRALPALCAPGAGVIWTRHRRPPDLTVDIRRWFAEAGFEPVAFDGPAAFEWSVGVQRYVGEPVALEAGRRLFTFLDHSDAGGGAPR
ncbi:MAG TPA: class I SAM-dependent methyltransferase [Candidatus Limnocylindrales bacterium]